MPEVLEKGVRYTIGLPEGLKRTIETDRIQTNFDFSEYRERFFPDMICSPFLLLSEVYLKTVMMYQRMCFLKELSYGIKRAVLMSHICW